MVRINWTPQSQLDLKNIAEFISKDSKRYAKIQVIKLRNRTERLKTNIRLGRIVPEFNDGSIRELIVDYYRIVYKITTLKTIHILTIHHSSRNFDNSTIYIK